MDAEDITPAASTLATASLAAITIPSDFKVNEVDGKLEQKPPLLTATLPSPLGVLANFTGSFAGTGINLIFRPNSRPPTTTTFPKPVQPPPLTSLSEDALELNLTTETLSFSSSLGSVPNLGLETQNDIFLNGVLYVQAVSDVTNPATGKADDTPSGIHFEPGLWMHIPATTTDRCSANRCIAGPPNIRVVDTIPFAIGTSTPIKLASQTAFNTDTPRLPQDLTKFIAAGTITQAILTDPNTMLRNANVGKTITKTIFVTVSTAPAAPELGGGTANIAFLEATSVGPHAGAVQMTTTFWIETVQHKIVVPIFKPGQPRLKIPASAAHPGARVPVFVVDPPQEVTAPNWIVVTSTQIQYSQTVFLNFASLTWSHVSVSTLISTTEQTVPPSAFAAAIGVQSAPA